MHVLIVEDEKKMAELLKKGLEEENHSVSLAFDGRDALEMAQALEYDAIVLDLMLPGIDGFEVARRLRKSGNTTPILVLTARDTVPDVVKGLDIGADDYMTKPFSFEEFLARLRAVSRRGSAPRPTHPSGGRSDLEPGFPSGYARRRGNFSEPHGIPVAGISDAARRAGRAPKHDRSFGLGFQRRRRGKYTRRLYQFIAE